MRAKPLAHTGQYILFAVLLLSYLKATGAEVMVARAFEGRETRMIFSGRSSSAASHRSVLAKSFRSLLVCWRLGAPLSAVMAFWLSSPLIDPPTLLITAGALGWPFAIGKAIAAVAHWVCLEALPSVPVDARQGAFAQPSARLQTGRMLRMRT